MAAPSLRRPSVGPRPSGPGAGDPTGQVGTTRGARAAAGAEPLEGRPVPDVVPRDDARLLEVAAP